jgi:glycolate oxidase iron-sulfur subunit
MCGLCLPHCPTYQISQNEAESPRGRISLIKAFSEGNLTSSDSLQTHLQSCTGCMKCQQVCPAKVPYQDIIDSGRNLYRPKLKFSSQLLQKTAITLLTNQWGHQLLSFISIILKPLPAPLRFVRLLKLITQGSVSKNSLDEKQPSITVLPGCTGSLFDQQTLTSITAVLEKLEIRADVPKALMCCGALAQHSGLLNKAQQQVKTISHFLSSNKVNQFISFASGCGRQFNQHFPDQHYDILTWLSSSTKFKQLTFSPTTQRVLVHTPCTLEKNDHSALFELLALIPGIQLLEFNDDISCCGAGGMQLMTPEESNRTLLSAKIDSIRAIQPDIIVSSNIGCSLSLQLGLQSAGLDISVIHPVTLLAKQLSQRIH